VRVAVLHNAVSLGQSESDQDVLEQARAVDEALQTLGHEPIRVDCTLDLASLRNRLDEIRPEVVFNLVESLGGSDWLIHVVPALLDVLGLPYTGSRTEAIFLSTQKLLAKERLRQAGLPTPDWIAPPLFGAALPAFGAGLPTPPQPPTAGLSGPWILKTISEHASFAIDDDSLVRKAPDDWRAWLESRRRELGRPCFIEQFVEGREFNLSLLAGAGGPQVLPPAEIDFSKLPEGKPRIVGYRAKWIADSAEYVHTPRRFDYPRSDEPLLARLGELARACWDLFGLGGYARVDFRVDGDGQPWILEINANPCLSPDAGFAAALARAGISFSHAVACILDAA